MYPITKVGILFNGADDVLVEIPRKGSRELDSRHFSRGYSTKQSAEWCRTSKSFEPIVNSWSITIYVLPNQVNLFVAKIFESPGFFDNFRCWSALLSSPRIRDDAKRTELVAAFDDWNKSDVR